MFRRLVCAALVFALAGSLWYVASVTYDTEFAETLADAADAAAEGLRLIVCS